MDNNDKIFNEYLEAKKAGGEMEFLKNHPDYKDELADFSGYISAFNELSQIAEIGLREREDMKKIIMSESFRKSVDRELGLNKFANSLKVILKPVSAFALITIAVFAILVVSGIKEKVGNLAITDFQKDISNIDSDLNAIESELYFLNEVENIFAEIDLTDENL